MLRKLWQTTYWMILLVGVIQTQSGIAKNEVPFKHEVVVDEESIYLSDVLEADKIPAELKPQFDKIRLGDAPKAGETRRFTNYAISEIIRHQLKNSNSDILRKYTLSIPNEVSVIRKSKFDIKDLEKSIKEWTQKSCIECEVEVNSLRLQNVKDLTGYDWNLATNGNTPRGHFTIGVELIKNRKIEKTVWAQGQLKIFRTVPVVRRDLAVGTKIQTEDIEFVRRDVTFERGSFPHKDEIYGSEVGQNISMNQILLQRNLKRKLALSRGSFVSVVLKNQGWTINAKAVAQDNGYIGDYVKVQNPETKRIITGIVTPDGTVEVR